MKKFKLIIALLAIASFATQSFAQDKATGLYLTAEDYVNHKLSFETTGADANHITLNEFLDGSKVTVWHDGKKHTFVKNEIFGYHTSNSDYRFFNNVGYRIIDTKDFYIYSHPKLVQQGKGQKLDDSFYFSASVKDAVEPLTIKDLEKTYAQNTKFKYTIESEFQSDNELTKYDAAIREYKVKYLFDESAK
jgi:hypothetical protein